MFDLEKLLVDVFGPEEGESVIVMIDVPSDAAADSEDWKARREMAAEWRDALEKLGAERKFKVLPLLEFPATGANNADLPAGARIGDEKVNLLESLKKATLVIAMTEFSATAPLSVIADADEDFRAASMPGVEKRMEGTALAADYSKVAAHCLSIDEVMRPAMLCEVRFSTGHRCVFDLRNREPEMDDGFLPRYKKGDRIINLPSGETFEVPYEGEIEGLPSWTCGTIPVMENRELILFHVGANQIIMVEGDGEGARRYASFFDEDPARANIAEVAFGVNDKAEVTGCVLEDEKAGFHWAFGRSDHLGGVVGVEDFERPENVVHQDIVYAAGNPIQAEQVVLVHPDGTRISVIENAEYVL